MTRTTTPPPAPPARPDPRPRGQAAAGTRTIDPFRVLRRHALLLVFMMFLGVVFGVGAWVLLDEFYPLYRGEVLFEIQPGLRESRDISSSNTLGDDMVFRIARTETVLLTSRPVLQAAMDDPEIQYTDWHEQFVKRGVFAKNDAVDALQKELGGNAGRNTNLFGLGWSAHRASDVPIVLNAISRQYLKLRKDLDDKVYRNNINVFENQVAQTNRMLDDIGFEIRTFLIEKGITTLDDPRYSQAALATQELLEKIGDSNASLSFTTSSLGRTEAKLAGTIQPTSEDRLRAEQDPTLQPLFQLLVNMKSEIRHLREKYPPEHPLVRNAESRVESTELEVEAKINEIMKRNLEAQVRELRNSRDSLLKQIEELEQELEAKDSILRDLAAHHAEYRAMEDRRQLLETKRDNDLSLLNEIRLMQARADASRVRLAQEALTPRIKAFPQFKMIVPLGVFVVVALTLGFVFLRELTDQRVKSASDLAVVPGARVLGVIPDVDDDPTKVEGAEMVVRKHPYSVTAESYRQVATPVLRAMDLAAHQTLVVVGGLPGAGSTTVATNLAAVAAGMGRKVLLVDANFRRPHLAEAMDLDLDRPGLGDLLHDEATLDEAIVPAAYGIDVITAGTPAHRIFERFYVGTFDAVMAQLRERYDLVILDVPPAVVAGDAVGLAHKVDAALLVVRASQEQRGLVARVMSQVTDARCDLLGIVLNRPRGTAGGYFKKNFATMAAYAENGDEAKPAKRRKPEKGGTRRGKKEPAEPTEGQQPD